jgi:hypothetical protein
MGSITSGLGIGGKINYLTKVGVLPVARKDDDVCFLLCYTFDSPLGDTEKVILLGLHTMKKANINILQHMKDSLEGNCTQLSFWSQEKTFDEALKELSVEDSVKRIFKIKSQVNPRDDYISTAEYDEVIGADLVNLAINHVETGLHDRNSLEKDCLSIEQIKSKAISFRMRTRS